MKRIKWVLLGTLAVCGSALLASANASAALPELGRCIKVEAIKEGKKHVSHGKFQNKACTKESKTTTGHFEWLPGPSTGNSYSNEGNEPVALETSKGLVVECKSHSTDGVYTGAKTQTVKIELEGCKDPIVDTLCQSPDTSATPPEIKEGDIFSQALEAELGFIKSGKSPEVGWDYKAQSGSDPFTFECGTATGVKFVLEGSFIGRVLKPIDKAKEEADEKADIAFSETLGKQSPEMFEGGSKDTLTAMITNKTEMTTEAIGYKAAENVENEEALEIKAIP